MRYLPERSSFPRRNVTRRRVEEAAQLLARKLRDLDIQSLPISDYNKRYLGQYLTDLDPVLQRYAFILACALESGPEVRVLLDYGGGSGMLSLLARAAHVPVVLYDDIFEESCRDARVIAQRLDLEADEYVHGEIDQVIEVLTLKNLSVDVVANNDVIEHIYDLEAFLRRLPDLSRNQPLGVALATGANMQNLYLRRRLQRLQRRREHTDRAPSFGHKGGESLKSYRAARAAMIREAAPQLANADVARLADATRGMMRQDVLAATAAFARDGRLPSPPKHPTNTCDPETGSWAEHLLPANWYRRVLAETGFHVRTVPGPYGWRAQPMKRRVARALDEAIFALRDRGIALSPFLVVHGQRAAR